MVIKAFRRMNTFSLVTFWADFSVIYTVPIPIQIMLSGFFQAISSEISIKKFMTNAAMSCYGKTSEF